MPQNPHDNDAGNGSASNGSSKSPAAPGARTNGSSRTNGRRWLDSLSDDDGQAEAPEAEPAEARSGSLAEGAPDGAFHADLHVSAAIHRFRPERLDATAMARAPRVAFLVRGCAVADVEVLDVSSHGLGLAAHPLLQLERGSLLEELRLEHAGQVIWQGAALVANAPGPGAGRFGVRLLGPGLDLGELRFRDELVERDLGQTLSREQQFERLLPAEWRACVASLHHTWLEVRRTLEAHEAADADDRWREPETCQRLCAILHARIWPATKQLMEELERQSAAFDAQQVELGLAFAQRALTLELTTSEFMYRAYAKPQGYAGDYRMMELGQSQELSGDSLFARYLQYWVQNTSLGHAIRSRGDVALRAAQDLIGEQRPVRILSLACGPAVELRQLVAEAERLDAPVEIVLLDQDEHALRSCMDELNRVIEERDDVDRIKVHCLHFSLRQILAPKAGAERRVVQDVLSGMDLIYSMGLFDYLVQSTAKKTVKRLFKLLNPGGRLLIGNLCRVADSSWIMEYGLAWHLIYRTHDEMVDMGGLIDTQRGAIEVQRDRSGYCLFLEARRHR